VSGFSRLIAGGDGGGLGKGRDVNRERSQRAKQNAFHGEPLQFEQRALSAFG
jgi:hypothetical protein